MMGLLGWLSRGLRGLCPRCGGWSRGGCWRGWWTGCWLPGIRRLSGCGRLGSAVGVMCGGVGLGATVVPVSGGMTDRQIRLIQDLRPDVLTCTPSYAIHLGEVLKGAGTSLKVGVFGAEPWTEEMRAQIENLLGLKA